jgi:hypothetical protein
MVAAALDKPLHGDYSFSISESGFMRRRWMRARLEARPPRTAA